MEPAAPAPDEKDWTWVLERPCPECGFDAAEVSLRAVPARLRAAVANLRATLEDGDPAQRPEPDVWSPLEYACHVRDACRVFGARIALMRGRPDPLFPNWDQDETARAEKYWAQDPTVVAAELTEEGERIAAELESVRGVEWQRTGRRSNGSQFTIESLARYLLHDLEHHVHDVTG